MNNSQQANSNADMVGNVVGRHGRYVVGKEGDVVGKNLTVVGKVDRVVGKSSTDHILTVQLVHYYQRLLLCTNELVRMCHYEIKCRKAVWLQVHKALWSNCKLSE